MTYTIEEGLAPEVGSSLVPQLTLQLVGKSHHLEVNRGEAMVVTGLLGKRSDWRIRAGLG